MSLLPTVVNVLSVAVIYLLFALAVVLAYRISRILLFCVGEIGMVSAYVFHTTWVGMGNDYWAFWLAVQAVLLVDALIGWLLFLILEQELRNDPFIGTVLTVAISILLVGVMAVVWGSAVEQLPLPNQTVLFAGQSFSLIGLGTILVGSVLAVIVLGFFYKTNIGIELQALANNRKLAVLAGIPVRSRMLGVWVGASVISGIAGVLLAAVASVSVEGAVVGFSGMVAAIIGGLTSPAGALVGALILALGETVVGLSFDIRYSIAVPVGLLVVLLAVRPWGLSARVEQITRT